MGACLSDRTHTGWAGPSVGERGGAKTGMGSMASKEGWTLRKEGRKEFFKRNIFNNFNIIKGQRASLLRHLFLF